MTDIAIAFAVVISISITFASVVAIGVVLGAIAVYVDRRRKWEREYLEKMYRESGDLKR